MLSTTRITDGRYGERRGESIKTAGDAMETPTKHKQHCFLIGFFGYFWLTIQNTTNRHVSNAFDLLAVIISFPLARAAANISNTTSSKVGDGHRS